MHALIPDDLLSELNRLQQRILSAGLPVLVIFEGNSGRVIGKVNNELIRCLEPRGVIYDHFDPSGSKGSISLLDFLQHTPCKGQIGLFDRSWYSSMIERYHGNGKEKELERMLDNANELERYLTINGVLIIKILLRASESALEEYDGQYGPRVPKRSFLSMDHIDPEKYGKALLDLVYKKTDTECAPWSSISVGGLEETVLNTVKIIMLKVNERLSSETSVRALPDIIRKYPNPREDMKLDRECTLYDEMINKLSDELAELQMELSVSDRSLIVCFEGWDAAGKGSCIKHLCHALNPRGYGVYQTKAPLGEEATHTYLWRFIRGLPERGHITIFDRTWYGRMMVEHIEGFCTEEEYRRSPQEINAFERMMEEKGIILVKIWLDITSEEQLQRFKKRKNDPLKQWKLTDEDWRNRSKWGEYDDHVDVMIESTNTDYAPWTVIDADEKKYTRVKVLKTVAETLKKELKN